MVSGCSVRLSVLMSRVDVATNAAPPIIISAGAEMASTPGLRMISVPMKPAKTAIQRRRRTTSGRNRAAPKVANSGAVKVRDVAVAKGISEMPVNHRNCEPTADRPRRPCITGRFVLKCSNPMCQNSGSMISKLTMLRKNTVCRTCTSCTAKRIDRLMNENRTPASSIHNAPRIAGGRADTRPGNGEGAGSGRG